MFQDTRPAELDPAGGLSAWAEFRVTHPQERARLLRELRDGGVPVVLNSPDGTSMASAIWALDLELDRLSFKVDMAAPQLPGLIDADEVVAVAYLASVKLQFDLQGFMLVRGANATALQCRIPGEIYRFQRRNGYRVRAPSRNDPRARFRHPALPDMQLSLRVLDVSIGGCALWLPGDVPSLQAGTRLGQIEVELDGETRFRVGALLQHVSSIGAGSSNTLDGREGNGVRLGCQWHQLAQDSERVLQRWIDRSQRRSHLLSLD
jgi:c-di-GMP-binding flagellar brake protein YcgR